MTTHVVTQERTEAVVDEVLRLVVVAVLVTMLPGLSERTGVDARGLRIAAVQALPGTPPRATAHPGQPPA